MRAHEIQKIVVEQVEALPVDFPAHAADAYRYDADQTDDEARSEGSFILEQGQLSGLPGMTSTAMRLRMFFVDGPEVGKRIVSAGERVRTMLPGISGALHQDLHGTSQIGDWIPSQSRRVPQQITCTIDFIVSYRLTFGD